MIDSEITFLSVLEVLYMKTTCSHEVFEVRASAGVTAYKLILISIKLCTTAV